MSTVKENGDSYPGPKPRSVDWFPLRDILRSGDIKRVVLLFALGSVELNVAFRFWSSEGDDSAYSGGDGHEGGRWELVVRHDCQRVGGVTEEVFSRSPRLLMGGG